MNTSRHRTTLLALLIAVVLGSAYVVVARNNATMGGARGDAPSGLIH